MLGEDTDADDEEGDWPSETAVAAEEAVQEAAEAVAEDIEDLSSVVAARDEYLDSLRRLQADFENYKKRIQRQQADLQERAAEKLVERLLPALDNFDLAMAHADADAGLDPVYRSLLGALESAGLERLDPAGQPFDPNEHDAVLHEEAEDSAAPEVIEVLRAGYRWKGRVLRPAMVKVKG
jgi:molecular chaperone GrpE